MALSLKLQLILDIFAFNAMYRQLYIHKNCHTCFLLLYQETVNVKFQINDFLLRPVFQVGCLTSTFKI